MGPIQLWLMLYFQSPPESISPLVDHLLRIGELLSAVAVLWKLVRLLNRFESVLRDYPPHRHINGSIVYPHDLQPGRVGHMAAAAGREH